MSIIAVGLTDTGKVRDHNEDAFAIDKEQGFFIVSDGMGGHQAGEMASTMVVKAVPLQLATFLGDPSSVDETLMVAALHQAIGDLSRQIYERALQTSALRGMGATVAACLVRNKTAAIAHMGDSRVYLMRSAVLERLTEDHSLVGMLLKLGQITKRQAKNHPARHTLSRYIGMEADVGPEVQLLDLEIRDRLLLCSDGLTNMVTDRAIAEILWAEPDLNVACGKLVQAANDAGGEDNITALIVQYGDWDKRPEPKKTKISVRRAVGSSLRSVDIATGEEHEGEAGGYDRSG